jgi:hypothetical protein
VNVDDMCTRAVCASIVGMKSIDIPKSNQPRSMVKMVLAVIPVPEPYNTDLVVRENVRNFRQLGKAGCLLLQ